MCVNVRYACVSSRRAYHEEATPPRVDLSEYDINSIFLPVHTFSHLCFGKPWWPISNHPGANLGYPHRLATECQFSPAKRARVQIAYAGRISLPLLSQVLVQECIRYNKLIDAMERSLPELQKALKGLVVMSGELEAVGKAIALNAVPEDWEAKVGLPLLHDKIIVCAFSAHQRTLC